MRESELDVHRYPWPVVLRDLLRATAGLAAVGVPLIVTEVATWVGWVLGSLCVLFAGFALLTVFRARTRIVTDDAGLTVLSPWRRALPWTDLDQVRLRYYALGSRKEQGWMQLTLSQGWRRIDIDSRLVGFEPLAARVMTAARAARVPLDEVTVANFRALGVVADDPDEALGPDARGGP